MGALVAHPHNSPYAQNLVGRHRRHAARDDITLSPSSVSTTASDSLESRPSPIPSMLAELEVLRVGLRTAQAISCPENSGPRRGESNIVEPCIHLRSRSSPASSSYGSFRALRDGAFTAIHFFRGHRNGLLRLRMQPNAPQRTARITFRECLRREYFAIPAETCGVNIVWPWLLAFIPGAS